MSLTPRPGRNLSRSQRTDRAFRLMMLTGGGAVATVVVAIVWSFGVAVILAILTVIAGWMLRRTLGR
jgi:hypothetical protein